MLSSDVLDEQPGDATPPKGGIDTKMAEAHTASREVEQCIASHPAAHLGECQAPLRGGSVVGGEWHVAEGRP